MEQVLYGKTAVTCGCYWRHKSSSYTLSCLVLCGDTHSKKKRLPSFVQGFKEIELESLILYTFLNQKRTALSYKFDNRT